MAIVQNLPCPSCQETGHDRSGDHLMVFADGAKLCNRAHFHKDGLKLYVAPDGEDPILAAGIDGNIKYTADQFNTLLEEGKLDNPAVRAIAIGGMRQRDAYEVMKPSEREAVEREWQLDADHFDTLKIKNLVTRAISGHTAKFYNVRVGLDANGKVERHYYPYYESGKLVGAKCRTLPKSFMFGTLGKVWGDGMLFGQSTLQSVLSEGRRLDTLVITGGECDAMAAQQMLLESQKGTSYEGKHFHVWSVMKGEQAIKEILHNKEQISRFQKILVCFDDDEVGDKMNRDVARLFRGKTKKIAMPSGCKDPNQCLMEGRHKEFVDAFWKPVDVFQGGTLKRIGDLVEDALKTPEMGASWPWPSITPLTFGIRDYALYVLGAGTGVGKTETTKEICFHLMEQYDETVGVVYLEEPAAKTVRSFAGKIANKRIEEPPINDPNQDGYSPDIDYTAEEAEEAIYALDRMDRLVVADTRGNKSVDTVMEILDEFLAMGIRKIVVDNLTAIEMPKGGSKVEAIDEAMKRIGTFKDEKPVSIFLVSHLTRPREPRVPHEMGGEVQINDFRGAGSITFWANVVIGIERNTYGETDEEKRLTTYRIVKCRDRGISVGRTVRASLSSKTGRLLEPKTTNTAPETKPELPKVDKEEF